MEESVCEKWRMPDDVQFDFVEVNVHMCIPYTNLLLASVEDRQEL